MSNGGPADTAGSGGDEGGFFSRGGNGLPSADILRLLLGALALSRTTRILAPRFRGLGTILTLHHVRPRAFDPTFSPNRILEITPGFLEVAIQRIGDLGFEFVSLDEARERIVNNGNRSPFVCITLDDGYADNLTDALPIFERHSVPFAIYVTTDLVDLKLNMWWRHLEDVIREHDTVHWTHSHDKSHLSTRSTAEKSAAFDRLYWNIRQMSKEHQATAMKAFAEDHGIGIAESCRAVALSWTQLQQLATNELVTIGAHTVSHRALAKLSPDEVGEELSRPRQIIRDQLGVEVSHACYPFGDRASAATREFAIAQELGFATATTTRKGVVVAEHRHHLHALPRIPLNGEYQDARYVEALLSGVPTVLLNRFRRLDVG